MTSLASCDLAWPLNVFAEFGGKKGASLHLWTSDDPFTSFTAHSNPDGTYSGTFSVQTGEQRTAHTQPTLPCLEPLPGYPLTFCMHSTGG